ncbi:MAG: hypothetical protein V3V74_04630 [Nitrosomonadaceae bacterium]
MGRMKELAIAIEESEMDLNFDDHNYTDDGAWWAHQDAQMIRDEHDELAAIEAQAEIEDERRTIGGW